VNLEAEAVLTILRLVENGVEVTESSGRVAAGTDR
jgi:hypothetical protein